jgi:type IV secretory pathway VirB2 component (pilin)
MECPPLASAQKRAMFATIAFLIAGIIWMFGESGGMSRKAVGLVVGGAIVFGVAPLITTLFEGSSGLLF